MRATTIIGVTLAAATLAAAVGCSNMPAPESLSPGFGNATAHNMAMHIIDPLPADMNLPAPDLNGQRGGVLMDRYVKGQVIAPERLTTTK